MTVAPFLRPALFGAAWLAFATLLAPDVAFRDSGELGGAAWQLGIAHPTGFSLDMIWLQAWTWLPVGSGAFRMSLGVAFASAACLVLLFDLAATLSPRRTVAGALVAVGALVTFATFLGTATLIEVYSTALVLTLASLREHMRERPRLAVLAVLAGLAVGAHVTAWVGCASVLLATIVLHRRTLCFSASLRAMALGAPVALALVAYYPLRSATDPAFDWGDPETPARLWEHLSAGRIRSAFADTTVNVRPFFSQLAELAWCVPLAFLAVTRTRSRVLLPGVLLLLDVAYGAWINPMGIVDRQVGHLAGAMTALLAGIGANELLAALPRPRFFAVATLPLVLTLGGMLSLVNADLDPDGSDALLGGAGVLGNLPPRAIYVCASDDACASALFARYAVGERPDVVVGEAQHLWEPRERAKLTALPASGRRPLKREERAALARHTLDTMRASTARPTRFEDSSLLAFRDQLHVAEPLVFGPEGTPDTDWGTYLAARPAASTRAAEVASRAYEAVGRGHLRAGDVASAYTAFARSVIATPRRAVTWINLGTAAARRGRWDEAIAVTELATRMEPERPTAWLNLARYRATRDPRDGLATLDQAARFVPEERLHALRAELSLPTSL